MERLAARWGQRALQRFDVARNPVAHVQRRAGLAGLAEREGLGDKPSVEHAYRLYRHFAVLSSGVFPPVACFFRFKRYFIKLSPLLLN